MSHKSCPAPEVGGTDLTARLFACQFTLQRTRITTIAFRSPNKQQDSHRFLYLPFLRSALDSIDLKQTPQQRTVRRNPIGFQKALINISHNQMTEIK